MGNGICHNCFLKQGISHVPFISQYDTDGTRPPDPGPVSGRELSLIQFICNTSGAAPRQIFSEDPPDDFCFFLLNDQLSVFQAVAVGCVAPDEGAIFHPFFIAPQHVARDGRRFVLGLGTDHAQKNLAGHFGRIDLLFFEQNADAQPCKQAHGIETVNSVSGKSGNGFRQNPVYLSTLAVRNHAVEFIPTFHGSARDALVSINIGESPERILADQLCVVFSLRRKGMHLVV